MSLETERIAVERLQEGVVGLVGLRKWQVAVESLSVGPLQNLALTRRLDQARTREDQEQIDALLTERSDLELKLAAAQLRIMELEGEQGIDGLTGVSNRRRLDDALGTEWRRCGRMQENLSVIFVDLDEFKAVNDAHGHRAGDALLVGIGQQLQRVMRRAGDLVGRYGGDEFVVVLPSTSLEEAGAIAQRIQSSLGRMQVLFGKMTLRVGASVGVACSNPYQDTGGVEDLLDRADSAVYAAKKLGRNLIIASVPGPDGFEFAHVQTVAKREPAPQVSVEPQRSARR